jgi:MHS family proline/betaine transporter-like MFS transporter
MTMSKHPNNLKLAIGATVLGNILEWYDFALMGMLAPLFSHLFFSEGFSLTHPLFFFTIGSFFRPIGGFIFGYLGDKSGRKTALIKTIMLMTVPVFIISVLPSYAEIGITATFVLGLVCVLQGICTGGEFPGSIVFLIETSPVKKRGFVGSWAYFGALLGMLLSALDLYLIDSHLSATDFESWGWRLPFVLGTLLGISGIILRRLLHETPIFEREKRAGDLLKDPLVTSFQKHKKTLLKGLGIFMLDAVGFNLIIVFSSSYFTETLKLSLTQAFALNTYTILMALILIPFAGKLSNRFGYLRLSKWSLWAMILFVHPLYLLMDPQALWTLFVAQGCLALLLSLYLVNLPTLVCLLFPPQVRYSSCAVVTNFSVALFGGPFRWPFSVALFGGPFRWPFSVERLPYVRCS